MAYCVVFFFQAEDGIRDVAVTGVQTCALPIFRHSGRTSRDEPYGAVEEDSFLARKPRYPRSHDLPDALAGEPELACRGFACRPCATIPPEEFANDRQMPFASLLAN